MLIVEVTTQVLHKVAHQSKVPVLALATVPIRYQMQQEYLVPIDKDRKAEVLALKENKEWVLKVASVNQWSYQMR